MKLHLTMGEVLLDSSKELYTKIISEEEYLAPEEACWIPYLLKFKEVEVDVNCDTMKVYPECTYAIVDITMGGLFIESYDRKTQELNGAKYVPWASVALMEFDHVQKNFNSVGIDDGDNPRVPVEV